MAEFLRHDDLVRIGDRWLPRKAICVECGATWPSFLVIDGVELLVCRTCDGMFERDGYEERFDERFGVEQDW